MGSSILAQGMSFLTSIMHPLLCWGISSSEKTRYPRMFGVWPNLTRLFSLWSLGVGAHLWTHFNISAKEMVLDVPEVEGTVTEIVCFLGVAALSLLGWVVAWRCPVWISLRRSGHLGFHAWWFPLQFTHRAVVACPSLCLFMQTLVSCLPLQIAQHTGLWHLALWCENHCHLKHLIGYSMKRRSLKHPHSPRSRWSLLVPVRCTSTCLVGDPSLVVHRVAFCTHLQLGCGTETFPLDSGERCIW